MSDNTFWVLIVLILVVGGGVRCTVNDRVIIDTMDHKAP